MTVKAKIPQIVLSVVFFAFLLICGFLNRGILVPLISQLGAGEIRFSQFTQKLSENYKADIYNKDFYVDLNGLYDRVTGRQFSNEVMKTRNGLLMTPQQEPLDVSGKAANLVDFAQWLNRRRIGFLYVQAPFKMDLEDKMMPPGHVDYTNEMADDMIAALKGAGLHYLDLRQSLAASPEMVKQNFYVTDHHWTHPAAFEGFRQILARLQQEYPKQPILGQSAAPENWQQHTLKNWFLGSSGRRVGRGFAGLDDITWLTPKFETGWMQCTAPMDGEFYGGSFEDAILRPQHLEKSSYYTKNCYAVSMGRDYSLLEHRNPSAPASMKVLLVKDSFALPIQGYLSTVFKELDVIDLRAFHPATLAQYVDATSPDLVLFLYNPRAMQEDCFFTFGHEEKQPVNRTDTDEVQVVDEALLEIPAAQEPDNMLQVMDVMQPNTRHVLTFDSPRFTKGSAPVFTVMVQGAKSGDVQIARCFSAQENAGQRVEWVFHTPEKRDEPMVLRIYPGLYGHGEDKAFQLENLKVFRYDVPQ